MQRRYIAIALLGWVAAGWSHASEAEHGQIDAVLKAFTAAWNRHDAKSFSNIFTIDARFTNVAGVGAIGRQAIEDFHAPRFAIQFKESHQVIHRYTVQLIKPDVASVDAWWEMSGARTANGEDAGRRQGLLSFVMVKNQGQWQIAVMHNMNLASDSQVQQ
jgi:uncharacterized protein (TIGR02246 family)